MWDETIFVVGANFNPRTQEIEPNTCAYALQECLRCGALVSTDKKTLHEGYHSSE